MMTSSGLFLVSRNSVSGFVEGGLVVLDCES